MMTSYGRCTACQHRLALLRIYGDKLAAFPTVHSDVIALRLMCLRGHQVADYAPGGRHYVSGGWKR